MKKRLIILTLIVLAIISAMCILKEKSEKKSYDTMVVPEYPLNAEVVSKAFKDSGFACIIEKHSQMDGMNSFSIRNENGNDLLASVKSQITEKKRVLGITFYTSDLQEDISEEFRKIIIIGTCLFGGFKDQSQVYNQYMKEVGFQKDLCWQDTIEHIQCEVKFQELESKQGYVMKVGFIAGVD